MNMAKWVADTIASPAKKGFPVLSFPAIQKMDVTVRDLIGSADLQAEAMRLVAESTPSAASVSFMDLSVEAESFGSRTVLSDDEVPTVVGSVVDEDTDMEALAVPEATDGRCGLYVEAIRKVVPLIEDRPVFAGMIGPFSLAGRLCDVNEIMLLCYDEPELVESLLEKVSAFLVEYAKAFKEAGADGVVMAEPLAGLLSPDLAAQFSGPYVKAIVEAVQDEGFGVVYHNCGPGVIKQIDSIVSNGAMGYHFGNAIDMADVLPLMPSDRLVMGNVDPAAEFRHGTPESVRAKTLEVLESCASYPNFVPSSGCDIPPMSPWENIDAFFDAVDEFYGKN